MRLILAIWVAKALILASKILGKKGSSMPGVVALKICPDLLRILGSKVEKTVVVCGTNGKTTTNNLIYSVLRESGGVVCNNVGANMLGGVACAFAKSAGIWGGLRARYACLEVDEFYARYVFDHITPHYLIVTNMFRDQLDRYGEIDIALNALVEAIAKVPECELILNGDDPLIASFDVPNFKHFFGVDEDCGMEKVSVTDGLFCKKCGGKLEYEYLHYNQLGKYDCPDCDFERPNLDFCVRDVRLFPKLEFTINDFAISVNYRGFYNIYNISACYALVSLMGVDTAELQKILDAYRPQIGRMESFEIRGQEFILNLSKNPAGFNQAIKTVMADEREKSIVVVINDNHQDGRDISWIWDVDFEDMNGHSGMILSGIRRDDLAVRLKHAGCKWLLKVPSVREAIDAALDRGKPVTYVLVNYTALFSTQKIMKGLSSK